LSLPRQELETAWNGIRAELRRRTTDLAFHLWLDPLELAREQEDTLWIRAPGHIRALVEERHLPLLRQASRAALGRPVTIRVVGDDWREAEPRPERHSLPAGLGVKALNPRYTFAQFVIGDGNRMAHAAALAVAEQPAQTYNPLFLYGPPGLGKTHLLHAVGNYVQRYGAGLTVRYTTSEDFTSGFVHAVRSGGIDEFKAAFRSADVLLLDDVQFLGERARTREEFFHTFDDLYGAGCQLVISGDRSPVEMTAFERRLTERFASGLVAELEPPSTAVRVAILRTRTRLDRLGDVDDAVLEEVARLVPSSVRVLEGALIQVVAYASLREQKPSPALVRHVIEGLHAPAARSGKPSISEIQRHTATAFGTRLEDLYARDRRPRVAFARQVAMYLARELTSETLPAIGESFGGRNHSTVLHAHRHVQKKLTEKSEETALVARLEAELRSPGPDRPDCEHP
jgi:chromosomal replication initiator protein